jgi:hypothetical protein
MADEKPITKSELMEALKELRKQVREDAFGDRAEFYAQMTRPEIEKVRTEMKSGFKQVDSRLARLEAEVSSVKDDIKGLTEELSLKPSRIEFNELKRKVDKYHPTA